MDWPTSVTLCHYIAILIYMVLNNMGVFGDINLYNGISYYWNDHLNELPSYINIVCMWQTVDTDIYLYDVVSGIVLCPKLQQRKYLST